MSEQFPPADEPTRMGPPPQTPQPQQGSWPAPGQQPQQPHQPQQGSWPAPGQQPQQPQQGSWPAPGQQPHQPQQGSWPAPGPQPGNPYDQPGGAAGGWGPPQGPGGPGGSGGPQGPWGPMDQPPSGGGRKGLVIGALVLVLLLIGGGIVAAVALTGDDGDNDAKGSEETSQTDDPSDEPSDDTETDAETTAPAVSSFEATNFDEVRRVCDGEAMSNAATWDPAAPVGLPFSTSPQTGDAFGSSSLGASQSWSLKDFGAFETTNFVICSQGTPSSTGAVQDCKNDDGPYEWHRYDWSVTLREASTGEVLHELGSFEAPKECPTITIVDSDRIAYSVLDRSAAEAAVNAWLTTAGGGDEGEGAPFEATSYVDLSRVCMGGAATNQPAFDPQQPKGTGFVSSEKEPNYAGSLSIGTLEKWGTDFQKWENTNFVVCVEGKPSESVPPRRCKASAEKEKGRFDFVQFDYHLTVRAAATAEVLTELDPVVPEFDTCPMFAFVDDDGVYTPTADTRDISERVDVWLAKERKRK